MLIWGPTGLERGQIVKSYDLHRGKVVLRTDGTIPNARSKGRAESAVQSLDKQQGSETGD